MLDIDASRSLEKALAIAAKQVAADTGFEIRTHRIDLVGICRDCS